jgi:hypothetical protein
MAGNYLTENDFMIGMTERMGNEQNARGNQGIDVNGIELGDITMT